MRDEPGQMPLKGLSSAGYFLLSAGASKRGIGCSERGLRWSSTPVLKRGF